MEYLSFPFELKAVADQSGHVEGYASTFDGEPDLQGDIVCRGAFAETIAENPAGWPMLFGHQMSKAVGFWTHAREDSKGLYVEGEFTLDSAEGASAAALTRHAHRLKQPFGLSIGYQPRPGGSKMQGDTRLLTSIVVFEISLASVPANQRARVTACKSEDPQVLRKEVFETLQRAGWSRRQIARVLAEQTAEESRESSALEIAKAFRKSHKQEEERLKWLYVKVWDAAHHQAMSDWGRGPDTADDDYIEVFGEKRLMRPVEAHRHKIAMQMARDLAAEVDSVKTDDELEVKLIRLDWPEKEIDAFVGQFGKGVK